MTLMMVRGALSAVALTSAALLGAPSAAMALTSVPDSDTLYISDYSTTAPSATVYSIPPGSLDATTSPVSALSFLTAIEAADNSTVTFSSYALGLDPDGYCSVGIGDLVSSDIESAIRLEEAAVNFDSCTGLTFDSTGTAWVTYQNTGDPVQKIGQVDLDTGEVLSGLSIWGDANLVPGVWIQWLASNPTTDLMYAGTAQGDVFSFDPVTGETVLIANMLPLSGETFSADFDSWGTLWFTVTPVTGTTELWTATPDDDFASPTMQGVLSQDAGPTIDYRALFLVQEAPSPEQYSTSEELEPELAATGTRADRVTAVALMTLTLGLILLLSRKLRAPKKAQA